MRAVPFLVLPFLVPASALAQPEKRADEPDPQMVRLLEVLGDSEKPLPDRVQAAISLGRRRDPAARPGLETAIRDEQPAIRSAIATALGRIGDVAALPALRSLRNDPQQAVRESVDEAIDGLGGDPDAPVEWTKVRRAVVLGELAIASDALRAAKLARERRSTDESGRAEATAEVEKEIAPGSGLAPVSFRVAVRREVRRVAALYLMPEGRAPVKVRRALRRRRVERLRLEGSVSKVRYRTNRVGTCVFAEVSLLLSGERSRNIRMTLSGAATAGAIGHAGRPIDVGVLEERAVAEAVRAALRHLESE